MEREVHAHQQREHADAERPPDLHDVSTRGAARALRRFAGWLLGHVSNPRPLNMRAFTRGAAAGTTDTRSGPELTLEGLLGLVDGALVGAGGQVLPAAVG